MEVKKPMGRGIGPCGVEGTHVEGKRPVRSGRDPCGRGPCGGEGTNVEEKGIIQSVESSLHKPEDLFDSPEPMYINHVRWHMTVDIA